MIEIAIQRFVAFFFDAIQRAWRALIEIFETLYIAGLFKFARVYAEVAIGRVQDFLEFVKSERVIYGQGADQPQAHAFVDEAVEGLFIFAAQAPDGSERLGLHLYFVFFARCFSHRDVSQ